MVVDKKRGTIVSVHVANGKKHDFKLFQESDVHTTGRILADSGYQGIWNIHADSLVPKKNTKLHKLSKEDKRKNHEISKERVFVENVIEKAKIFKIVSERYRNRRKRFGLRIHLIAGLVNAMGE